MIQLYVKKNPFVRHEPSSLEFEGASLRTILKPLLSGEEFDYPTIVRVNGIPRLRADWDALVEDGSTVEVCPVIGAAVPAAIAIANVVMLVATAAFTAYGIYKAKKAMRALRAGVGAYEADPFYTIDGRSNKVNLNNPIEVAYGRNRIWPSYICRPFSTYRDDRPQDFVNGHFKNTTFVQIFCIGQGEFDIHSVQVGNTPIAAYRGMTYEVVPPGGKPSANSIRIAYVQPDLEPFELTYGKSSEMYIGSPVGANCRRFEVDIEFSGSGTYQVLATMYKIDSNNRIIDSSLTGITNSEITLVRSGDGLSESNSAPHRETHWFAANDENARYGIVFKYWIQPAPGFTVKILEVRSYMDPSIPVQYSDKTLLIVKYSVRQLDDEIANDKINVVATRKLLTCQRFGTYKVDSVQPTRSIPWAIYDVLRNPVYGGGLSEDFIDMDSFSEIDAELALAGIYYDGVFNQVTTVEDAVKTLAQAGRCFLAYNGSKLALRRDNVNDIPEGMFTPDNIVEGSFSWSSELFDPTEPDAIEATYVDPDSGEELTTMFVTEGSAASNVQKINLQGFGSKTQAWREAAYRKRKLELIRDTFKFRTGMEGYVPSIGATCALSWDLLQMGSSGIVENFTFSSGFAWVTLSSDFLTVLNENGIYGTIFFRNRDGSAMGPFYILDYVPSANHPLNRTFKIPWGVNLDYIPWQNEMAPMQYIAVPSSDQSKIAQPTQIKIEDVSPSDDGTVEITATNYDPRVYEFDYVEPPADDTEAVVDPTGALNVPWLRLEQLSTPTDYFGNGLIRFRWMRVYGAESFTLTIYYSNGAAQSSWSGFGTHCDLSVPAGQAFVASVTARNGATVGPATSVVFDAHMGQSFTTPVFISGFTRFDGDNINLQWGDVPGAEGYFVVAVFNGNSSVKYPSAGTQFQYTPQMFKYDFVDVAFSGASLTIAMQVSAVVDGVETAASSTQFVIPRPSSPSGIEITLDAPITIGTTQSRRRRIAWEGDGSTYEVFFEAYTSNPTFVAHPWLRVATIDKKLLTTTIMAPKVQVTNQTVYNITNYWDPDAYTNLIYGPGIICQIGFTPGFIMDIGTWLDEGLWLYQNGDEWSGRWVRFKKIGNTQTDGIVFIPGLTAADLGAAPRATIVYPQTISDAGAGVDWRIKGAISALSPWANSRQYAISTFDMDN